MDEIYGVFIQEAREQLGAMEDGLLRMEQHQSGEPVDADLLNAIFRAAHTIKGASGVVELHHIERFTHTLESLLDRLRNHELQPSSEMITLLLQGCDHIGSLIAVVERGQLEEDPSLTAPGQVLAEGLRAFGQANVNGSANSTNSANTANTVPQQEEGASTAGQWHLSIRFGADVLKMGMEPLNFLRYLEQLGTIVGLHTLYEALPEPAQMDAEACYLGFELGLQTSASAAEIENVFAFCQDDCELHLLPPHSPRSDYLALIARLPEPQELLHRIFTALGVLGVPDDAPPAPALAVAAPTPTPTPTPAPAPIPVSAPVPAPAPTAKPATAAAPPATARPVAESRLIRVQADKLDQLIDLVGELVIAGDSASLLARRSGHAQLVEATSVLNWLVENIRDSALQLRMVQIGETFNRFNRVVRDTAREIGKDIQLQISGADTELDKSVVEKIGDPLMHLVRNAMDHGLEPPAVRLAAGKSATGHLQLNAYHDSGNIIIEVKDDGAGINAEKVHQKALDRGLIAPGQHLSEREIANLIFEAGFSTVEAVSNLSGRGVGMDVVRRNIQALRGTVEVRSTAGQGACFTIRLPLTLAIIDGFLTAVGQASYVIPLDSVVECLELKAQDTRGHMLNLRGEVLPFIRLRDFFGLPGQASGRENVVVITAGNRKAGIVVDQLLGEFQTVIKPLGQLFRHLRGIGGSTILGSGEVALILDVQALVQLAAQRDQDQSQGQGQGQGQGQYSHSGHGSLPQHPHQSNNGSGNASAFSA